MVKLYLLYSTMRKQNIFTYAWPKAKYLSIKQGIAPFFQILNSFRCGAAEEYSKRMKVDDSFWYIYMIHENTYPLEVICVFHRWFFVLIS